MAQPINPTKPYQTMSFLGIEGILIDERISTDDPALTGKHIAFVRHEDSGWADPCELTRHAPIVNYLGAFVSTKPVLPANLGTAEYPYLFLTEGDWEELAPQKALCDL